MCSSARGPAIGAVLGDVSDEQRRQVAVLGDPHQRSRDGADLRDTSGGTVDVCARDGLDGVDDQQIGPTASMWPSDSRQVDLGGEVESVFECAGALRPHPHLRCRLLARDVEHPLAASRRLGGHLEQQGGLADAGLAGQQEHRAGNDPATEDAVELGHAAALRRRGLALHLRDRHSRATDRPRDHSCDSRCADLLDCAPGLALAAAADPLHRGPAALAAAVGRGGALRRLSRHDDGR